MNKLPLHIELNIQKAKRDAHVAACHEQSRYFANHGYANPKQYFDALLVDPSIGAVDDSDVLFEVVEGAYNTNGNVIEPWMINAVPDFQLRLFEARKGL